MDIIKSAHHTARLPILHDQAAVHPVPYIIPRTPRRRGTAHFECLRPSLTDIINHNGDIVRVDDFLFQKDVGIIVKFMPADSHARPRFIADEHILIHQVFKHHGRAGFHGHPVHLLFPFQLYLQRLALCDIHYGPLDDMVPLRGGGDHHVGPFQPVDGSVLPPGPVFPVLPVARLPQFHIAAAQHLLVLGQHISQHPIVPVRQPLLHGAVTQ